MSRINHATDPRVCASARVDEVDRRRIEYIGGIFEQVPASHTANPPPEDTYPPS